MENSFVKIIEGSGAPVVIVAMFLFFQIKQQKENQKMYERFNETIEEYLRGSIKVKQELSARLQEFSDVIREQKEIIQDMYKQLVVKTKKIKDLEKT